MTETLCRHGLPCGAHGYACSDVSRCPMPEDPPPDPRDAVVRIVVTGYRASGEIAGLQEFTLPDWIAAGHALPEGRP